MIPSVVSCWPIDRRRCARPEGVPHRRWTSWPPSRGSIRACARRTPRSGAKALGHCVCGRPAVGSRGPRPSGCRHAPASRTADAWPSEICGSEKPRMTGGNHGVGRSGPTTPGPQGAVFSPHTAAAWCGGARLSGACRIDADRYLHPEPTHAERTRTECVAALTRRFDVGCMRLGRPHPMRYREIRLNLSDAPRDQGVGTSRVAPQFP